MTLVVLLKLKSLTFKVPSIVTSLENIAILPMFKLPHISTF